MSRRLPSLTKVGSIGEVGDDVTNGFLARPKRDTGYWSFFDPAPMVMTILDQNPGDQRLGLPYEGDRYPTTAQVFNFTRSGMTPSLIFCVADY